MGLRGFERRLEQLVEGTFAKAFRGGLQPVEIGRKVVREVDAGRQVGLRGTTVPNEITVSLSDDDFDRFGTFSTTLVDELADAVRSHARDERYAFVGPVTVTLTADPRLGAGRMNVAARTVEGTGAHLGALVLPDGSRHQLNDTTATIGRMPTCTVPLADPQASRVHAEIRPDLAGYMVVDMGSTNGTLVNGAAVAEHQLADGDEIQIGTTVVRFEAS